MDEHAEWFGRVMRAAFYPELQQEPVTAPERFRAWLNDVEGAEFIDTPALDRLKKLHDEMHVRAGQLVAAARDGRKPPVDAFDIVADMYDEFVLLMRRFERDCVLEDSGMDAATGLRSRRVMRKDLEREMERRSRRGKPFSLALVRIDRYDDIRAMQNVDEHARLLMTLADMIRLCLRSFDDAYRSGDGEFIMSLKHADISGGASALNRLRRLLEDEEIVFGTGADSFPLTLSGCVAEPLPGDDLSILLGNMRQDLGRYGDHAGAALQYHEISPLQRFVETIEEHG
jgi:diguanylate cyclase (GGDEF)-like protein